MADAWDPAQYDRFRDERSQPFFDLMALVQQKRLDPALWGRFLDRYRERLLPRLPDRRPFFFTFQRILVWGRR